MMRIMGRHVVSMVTSITGILRPNVAMLEADSLRYFEYIYPNEALRPRAWR